jgi:hypothetical protein
MGHGIAGLSGEQLFQTRGSFIDAALLEERVSLGYISPEKAGYKEQEQSQDKDASRRCRSGHS